MLRFGPGDLVPLGLCGELRVIRLHVMKGKLPVELGAASYGSEWLGWDPNSQPVVLRVSSRRRPLGYLRAAKMTGRIYSGDGATEYSVSFQTFNVWVLCDESGGYCEHYNSPNGHKEFRSLKEAVNHLASVNGGNAALR